MPIDMAGWFRMQDILRSLNDRFPLTDRQSALDQRLRRIHRDILRSFADTGFPPLKMRLDDEPQWLNDFSGEPKP